MPGKTSQASSKNKEKPDSSGLKDRLSSSQGRTSAEAEVKKIPIWPEWNETDIANEKWDLGAGGKGREKAKASQPGQYYDDNEGVSLPPSLGDPSDIVWRRPSDPSILCSLDYLPPVIVKNPDCTSLDLYSSNKHLFHSQLMSWIIGQLYALWEMQHLLSPVTGGVPEGEASNLWRPWEHIQPQTKGQPAPHISPSGKYCVRLFWLGYWRKIVIDDKLPFLLQNSNPNIDVSGPGVVVENVQGSEEKEESIPVPLYPRTRKWCELWPALLTKAILKIVSLDYSGGHFSNEFGDSSIIHMLTGWPFYTIPIKSLHDDDTWNTLSELLPLWERKEDTESEDMVKLLIEETKDSRDGDKESDKDEIKKREKCLILGTLGSTKSSFSGQMSKLQETLKNSGVFPPNYDLTTQSPYPILLTQLRNIPLIPPPKEPPLPTLKAPYYLGLTHRQPDPWDPNPLSDSPDPEPRFVEVLTVLSEEIYNDLLHDECTLSPRSHQSEGDRLSIRKVSSGISNFSGSKKNMTVSSEKIVDRESGIKTTELKWMNFADFTSTFKNIHIFKCPYKYRDTLFDISKTTGNAVGTSKKAISSRINSASKYSQPLVKDDNYLFVDNVEPTELLFIFSSLSNWKEGGKDTHVFTPPRYPPGSNIADAPQVHVVVSPVSPAATATAHHSPHQATSTTPNHQALTLSSMQPQNSSSAEQQSMDFGVKGDLEVQQRRRTILCGSLVVETYSWQTVQFGNPVLRVNTTGTQGHLVSLPPGRHVFKLHVKTPIGHHLEIFSQSPFILLSEDAHFTYLSQDSSRFIACSTMIIKTLIASSKHCKDLEELEENLQPLSKLFSQYNLHSGYVKLLLTSVLQAWSTLTELDNKMQTGWKAFLFKAFSILENKVVPQEPCPISDSVSTLKHHLKVHCEHHSIEKVEDSVQETEEDREPTAKEEKAAKIITHFIQKYSKECREDRMVPGSEANNETSELLEKSIPKLEPHIQNLGTSILHGFLKLDPSIVENFPFSDDIASWGFTTFYHGPLPQMQPNSWTVALRKKFRISVPQLMAFSFQCPVSTCLLRVIDNDTMTEMPRVFQSTIPRVYQPNKKGYTLQAEVWLARVGGSTAEELEDKKWKLRIVTSNRDEPPIMEDRSEEDGLLEETLHKEEMIDYCLPDREDVMFRYSVFSTNECEISLQATVSKQDALIKLEVVDQDQVPVTATEGRGTCIIPLCTLQAPLPTTEHQSSEHHSQTEHQEHPTEKKATGAKKTPKPAKHHEQEHEKEPVQYSTKYVVIGRILRKSWPTNDTAWPYIAIIKGADTSMERSGSGSGAKPEKEKEKKSKNRKKSSSVSSVSAQQVDISKPHWVLRIVSKDPELKVKKNTEKADQLRGMVQAWEAEQPGRSQKARESRQKFLDARAIQETKPEDIDDTKSSSTNNEGIPRPNTGPVKIWQMDLTPFIIKTSETPKLLDETEQARRLAERQKLFQEYRISRQAILQLRNEDREQRNEAKLKQLELAEEWQADLDVLRNELNSIREAIRERYIAKEKEEAELATLKAQEEVSAGGRDSKKSKGGKKKK